MFAAINLRLRRLISLFQIIPNDDLWYFDGNNDFVLSMLDNSSFEV